MKKLNAALLLLILCLTLGSPLGAMAQENEAIAVINGVAITRDQFYGLLEKEYGFYALQELVQKELVRQKSETLQINISDEEFAEVYAMVMAQIGGPQALQMFLMQNNATEAQFIQQIRWNVLLGKLASAEVEVTEEGLAQWFAENRQYYDQPETVEVSHILVETEEEAKEILVQLQAGGDLAALAVEHSLDPGSASQGGYLGQIGIGLTVAEFEEMAFSLAVGEFGATQSTFGWHVITVHSKNEAVAVEYDEIAELVEEDYRASRALDLRSYMTKLEEDADLEILWPAK